MSPKNYISILIGVTLLVGCAQNENNKTLTTTAAASSYGSGHHRGTRESEPMPSPTPSPGKRTETGTVITFDASQITLQVPSISSGYPGAGTAGTFQIHRTASTKVTGTLVNGSTVTVESNTADWHQIST